MSLIGRGSMVTSHNDFKKSSNNHTFQKNYHKKRPGPNLIQLVILQYLEFYRIDAPELEPSILSVIDKDGVDGIVGSIQRRLLQNAQGGLYFVISQLWPRFSLHVWTSLLTAFFLHGVFSSWGQSYTRNRVFKNIILYLNSLLVQFAITPD